MVRHGAVGEGSVKHDWARAQGRDDGPMCGGVNCEEVPPTVNPKDHYMCHPRVLSINVDMCLHTNADLQRRVSNQGHVLHIPVDKYGYACKFSCVLGQHWLVRRPCKTN